MKTFLTGLLLLGSLVSGWAITTINATNKFAYGANIGWMDWRGDTNSGAVIGEYICSGYIYAANVGWIHLGSNAPANGIQYQNNSATDYGVNVDGLGNLSGLAYGANIGWINFTNGTATGPLVSASAPRVNLGSGKFSGFAYSANCGWISLSNSFVVVQTDAIQKGTDTDGDGIADAWERTNFGNLTTANATNDFDADGFKDVSEYLADTSPTNPDDKLLITAFVAVPGTFGANDNITWSSKLTRSYRVQKQEAFPAAPWLDSGLNLISPDGTSTTRLLTDTYQTNRFYRVQAVRPLTP
jgi:hypothetical protein